MKQTLLLLTTLLLSTAFQAQNLDKMNEADRKEAILRIAKEIVMEFGPDFYREYKEPEIEHGHVSEAVRRYFSIEQQKKYKDRSYYTVKYLYDKNEESFYQDYSALVWIWGDTGEAFVMDFGSSNMGRTIEPNRDKSKTEKWTWEKRPPGSFPSNYRVTYSDGSDMPDDAPDKPRAKPQNNEEKKNEGVKKKETEQEKTKKTE